MLATFVIPIAVGLGAACRIEGTARFVVFSSSLVYAVGFVVFNRVYDIRAIYNLIGLLLLVAVPILGVAHLVKWLLIVL